jgi:hypothetical protein
MSEPSAICLFSEDIRAEKSGQDTIVGTLPDNLNLEGTPPPAGAPARAMLPKLSVYLRINLDIDSGNPKAVAARVLNTNDDLLAQSDWTSDVIDKAFIDSRANQMPLVGLVFKVIMSPLPITGSGKIRVIATVDGTDYLAGALNVILNIAPSLGSKSTSPS